MKRLFSNQLPSRARFVWFVLFLALVFGPPLLFGMVLGVKTIFRDGLLGLFSAVGFFFGGFAAALLSWLIVLSYLWAFVVVFIVFPYLAFKKLAAWYYNNKSAPTTHNKDRRKRQDESGGT